MSKHFDSVKKDLVKMVTSAVVVSLAFQLINSLAVAYSLVLLAGLILTAIGLHVTTKEKIDRKTG